MHNLNLFLFFCIKVYILLQKFFWNYLAEIKEKCFSLLFFRVSIIIKLNKIIMYHKHCEFISIGHRLEFKVHSMSMEALLFTQEPFQESILHNSSSQNKVMTYQECLYLNRCDRRSWICQKCFYSQSYIQMGFTYQSLGNSLHSCGL